MLWYNLRNYMQNIVLNRAYVGRLAPSPTGALHLGNVRTFMVAWLRARAQGGRRRRPRQQGGEQGRGADGRERRFLVPHPSPNHLERSVPYTHPHLGVTVPEYQSIQVSMGVAWMAPTFSMTMPPPT